MIRKIDSIGKLAVFNGFEWDKSVRGERGNVRDFKAINIIYGRNYSGKTTLSRILRAMETGELSDKFENPSFSVAFSNGAETTQADLLNHGKQIRVFNEDFVRSNLRFITNPDDSIEAFAILGDDNNKIEEEIKALEAELGSSEEGKETGLHEQKKRANEEHRKAFQSHKRSNAGLENQLAKKATGGAVSIKYRPERFGDQNYNIQKLKTDIKKVRKPGYRQPSDDEVAQYEKLISERTLKPISPFHAPNLEFTRLAHETENLITQKISESHKIEELVKDAVLNRWVSEGRHHHKGKRKHCAFCANIITEGRWKELEKHFDEESARLEKDVDALIDRIETEKSTTSAALAIDKSQFYSKFHNRLDELSRTLQDAAGKYDKSLETLAAQLKARKEDILHQKVFEKPDDASDDLLTAWSVYESIRKESDNFTSSLNTEQKSARDALRLKEISDYLITIGYHEQVTSVEMLKEELDRADQNRELIEGYIREKELLIDSKKRELNDEEKGAKKVNEYLNNIFGHQFLTLEAKKDAITSDEKKRIRFEVIRAGKRAYHLSEGECRLLAFCYFLAKLDDIDTRDSKPIIWIDDPISSLDGNHVFFVYSLLNAEIVASGKFEQLFISTHSLDFLKYLKRIDGKAEHNDKKGYFVVVRKDESSNIEVMPKYLKKYVTEFNYLFHQIHKCAAIETVDDTNYTTFYNFANNARKFFEIYLYYKYPDQGMTKETLRLFFGGGRIPAVLTDRINNEYSHLCGVFERGSTPVEVPEMRTAARQIIERLQDDKEQYSALLKSIGAAETSEPLR